MTRTEVSRRNLLATGVCALAGAVSLPGPARAIALGGQNLTNEEIIRKWYAAWEKKDLGTFNNLLADNFTFSSAAGDDHISKSTFKTQCWDTQINFIAHFDLERITTGVEDAFVKYLCHTNNGNRSGTWSISESRMESWNRLSAISARSPAFRQPLALSRSKLRTWKQRISS